MKEGKEKWCELKNKKLKMEEKPNPAKK